MAHNINFNEQTGKHSFFSVQQQAWHGLGQVVSHCPTSAEAIGLAGLDYQVIKEPNRHLLPTGETIVSENSFFTYRSDNMQVLGDKLGPHYEIVQNRDAFSFFDAIVGGGDGILFETAGALGKGERIFITAKLPGYIRVGSGDDVTEKYLFFTTTHDGSGSITAAFTPIRIVCQNTLNAALRNMTNMVRIKHTTGAKERFEDAQRIMGISNRMADQLEGVFNQWAKVSINDREVRRLIELALCPNRETLEHLLKGNREELSSLFTNQCAAAFEYAMVSDTQQMETTKGTLFGAYNAVTGYFQNVRSYQSAEDKLKAAMMGGIAQQRGQAAFNLCMDFADKGRHVLQLN